LDALCSDAARELGRSKPHDYRPVDISRCARLALKLDAALFLDAGLFNRGHLAFEIGEFRSGRTIPANEECRGPENNKGHPGCNLIVGPLLILGA